MPAQVNMSPNARFNMSLKKTKICRYFLMGKCNRQSTCRFAHGKEEVAAAPDYIRIKLCPNAEECTNQSCKFAHCDAELRCIHFVKGQCTYGENCKYSHEESGREVEVMPEMPAKKLRRRNRPRGKRDQTTADLASISTDVDENCTFDADKTDAFETISTTVVSSSESECSATEQETMSRLTEVEASQTGRTVQVRLVLKNTFLDLECEECIVKLRPRSNSI